MKTPDPKTNLEAGLDTLAIHLQLNKVQTMFLKTKVNALFQTTIEAAEIEARIDELSNLINSMNAGDEYLHEPTTSNKGWNGAILNRITNFKLHHKKGSK